MARIRGKHIRARAFSNGHEHRVKNRHTLLRWIAAIGLSAGKARLFMSSST
jgi:hypothetical protein